MPNLLASVHRYIISLHRTSYTESNKIQSVNKSTNKSATTNTHLGTPCHPAYPVLGGRVQQHVDPVLAVSAAVLQLSTEMQQRTFVKMAAVWQVSLQPSRPTNAINTIPMKSHMIVHVHLGVGTDIMLTGNNKYHTISCVYIGLPQ